MRLGELQKKVNEMVEKHGKNQWAFITTEQVNGGIALEGMIPIIQVSYIGIHDNDEGHTSLILSYDDCDDDATLELTAKVVK